MGHDSIPEYLERTEVIGAQHRRDLTMITTEDETIICFEEGGVDALTFHAPVYVGDTLTARSVVVDKRGSKSHPEMGIVTWQTEGTNQNGILVVDYRRTNLVRRRI